MPARPCSAFTNATAASIMIRASSKERETGTSIRGRVANISLAASGFSWAEPAESINPAVTIVRSGINISAKFDENNFCRFIFILLSLKQPLISGANVCVVRVVLQVNGKYLSCSCFVNSLETKAANSAKSVLLAEDEEKWLGCFNASHIHVTDRVLGC